MYYFVYTACRDVSVNYFIWNISDCFVCWQLSRLRGNQQTYTGATPHADLRASSADQSNQCPGSHAPAAVMTGTRATIYMTFGGLHTCCSRTCLEYLVLDSIRLLFCDMPKCGPRRVRYPCVICDRACGVHTIECSACASWTHRQCVPLSTALFKQFADSDVTFRCRRCACDEDGTFNYKASLQR